jgi:polyhydroxyalkanoate synthase
VRAFVDPPPTTPFDVVFETGLLRLRHYSPEGQRRGPPVLLVYSLFKRPYVLDLLPDRSVVRSLLRQGLSVYLTDWLPPVKDDAQRSLQDYVEGDLASAVQCVRCQECVERIALTGGCLGGFLATVYAALHAQHVERLAVFALPFASRPPFAPAAAEYLAGMFGNVPAWWIAAGLNARVSDPRSLRTYLAAELGEPDLEDAGSGPEARALRRAFASWLDSDVPFAGRLFLDVMGDAYGRGQFAASRLVVGGRRVALEDIRCPVLNVCAKRDQLVPLADSAAFVQHVGSREAANVVFDCGHVGLMLSRAAHATLWPRIGRWLCGDESPVGTAADSRAAG